MTDPTITDGWYVTSSSDTVIIFVHGIFSSSAGCWHYVDRHNQANNRFWPNMVFQDKRFQNPSIYLGGYETSISSGDLRIKDAARIVLGRRAAEIARIPEACGGACCGPKWCERERAGASRRSTGAGWRTERHPRPSPVNQSRLDPIPRSAGSPHERRPLWRQHRLRV